MTPETYQQQLVRLTQAMVQSQGELLKDDLECGSQPTFVKFFGDGNLDKRCDKLLSQLEFVAESFDDFEAIAMKYIRRFPQSSYEGVTEDAERMLQWLLQSPGLTRRQRDYVACQRARHAIEFEARKKRIKHIRFQELVSLVETLKDDFGTDSSLRIYLNPLRFWTRFITGEFLEDAQHPPANVLFFAIPSGVSTAVLELEGQALINELADYEPCTLTEWSALSQLASQEQLVELCRDLADMGLAAFG